jgi:4'-phosphopantetheinyl transferase
MVLHLLQTVAAHPALAAGQAPEGLLHPLEAAQLAGLRVVKRRREWLLGRWTAKHLVRMYLAHQGEQALPALATVVIRADADGAPYVALASSAFGSADGLVRLPLSLSISHSGDRAFCALADEARMTVGADIERIEPRQAGFVAQFFTPSEQAAVVQAAADRRETIITAIWSAKEAVLKALRLGLRVDTRRLSCLPTFVPDVEDWWSLTLGVEELPLSPTRRLYGRWRIDEGFVQTLVCAETGNV